MRVLGRACWVGQRHLGRELARSDDAFITPPRSSPPCALRSRVATGSPLAVTWVAESEGYGADAKRSSVSLGVWLRRLIQERNALGKVVGNEPVLPIFMERRFSQEE
jgi:hypothetical protein